MKPPWWQWPAVVGGIIMGLTALGTGIVMASKYLTLPEAMAAVQRQNALQDEAIIELKKSNEVWQQIYQRELRFREVEDGAAWCCEGVAYERCWDERLWTRCD